MGFDKSFFDDCDRRCRYYRTDRCKGECQRKGLGRHEFTMDSIRKRDFHGKEKEIRCDDSCWFYRENHCKGECRKKDQDLLDDISDIYDDGHDSVSDVLDEISDYLDNEVKRSRRKLW